MARLVKFKNTTGTEISVVDQNVSHIVFVHPGGGSVSMVNGERHTVRHETALSLEKLLNDDNPVPEAQ